MQSDKTQFSTEQQALDEISAAGYHAVTLDIDANEVDAHWHDFSSMTFILEGNLEVIDIKSGVKHNCGKGSRIIAQSRELHSEKTDGFRAVIGLSVEPDTLTQPINKPAESLPA